MPYWVNTLLDNLPTNISDFVIIMLNSYYGYQRLITSDSDEPGLHPVFLNQARAIRPSRRQIRRSMCNLDKVPMEVRPTRQFRRGHENCYNCIRGVCNYRRRRRSRIPRTSTKYGRYRQLDDSIDDGYEADDEWEPPYFFKKNSSSEDSDDDDDDEYYKRPPGHPKVMERLGNCTYYHGYGG